MNNEWNNSQVGALEKHLGVTFPNIRAAYERSVQTMADLQEIVGSGLPDEASFVVFGSLARKEFTAGSDIDWCLVIDGKVSASHRALELELKRKIKESGKFKDPNPTGAFGALVFSHELVHCIGGSGDTNANLTRRILLLLESAETGGSQNRVSTPREQVMRSILQRYFEEEAIFPGKGFFPRFFLNDIIRLWRTIAVDYAAKNSERGSEKWALRSAKLRFSRKLLYVAGLLLTFETTLFPQSKLGGLNDDFDKAKPQFSSTEHCLRATNLTPLEILARACMELDVDKSHIAAVFKEYDAFLELMNSEEKREQLGRLGYDEAMKDQIFQTMRDMGHRFQEGLEQILLADGSKLGTLTKQYVIF